VAAFFADPPPGAVESCTTTDGEHGRIEVRRHTVRHEVGWLLSDRRYPGEPAFPGLAMLGMVESETERDGEVGRERRYCLGPARLDAAAFGRAARGHRGIEDRPHWVLDVVFGDDLSRLRAGEHGRGQARGGEPAAPGRVRGRPQEPPQARRPEHRRPREPHPPDRVNGRSPDRPGR
jgi:hypothetical protein